MAHGIFEDRCFAYNVAHGAAWHNLGVALADPTVAALFSAGGIPAGAALLPLLAVINGLIREVPETRVVYWTDETGNTLDAAATVGADYTLFDPAAMRERMEASMRAFGGEISTAGRIGRRGQILFASAKIGTFRLAHDASPVEVFMNLSTSVDSSMRTAQSFSIVRVVCQNTLSASLADAALIRHTSGHHDRLDKHAEAFAGYNGFLDKWRGEAETLAIKRVSKDLAARIVGEIYPGTSKRRQNQRDNVLALFEGGAQGSGGTDSLTAWQLLQALTEYDQHASPQRVESGRNPDMMRIEHVVDGGAATYASTVTSMLLAA